MLKDQIKSAVGEHSHVAIPAAVANAVYDAVGVRLMALPIIAEKVYRGLKNGVESIGTENRLKT